MSDLLLSDLYPNFNGLTAFSELECKEIIVQAEALGFKAFESINGNTSFCCRPASSIKLTEGPLYNFIVGRLRALVPQFNRRYDFDLFTGDDLIPVVYLLKYRRGQNLSLHSDMGGTDQMSIRKLNITVKLNEDFSEGDLTLFSEGNPKPFAGAPTGLAVSYPSWTLHEVAEVDSGIRYTIAAWLCGPRFK